MQIRGVIRESQEMASKYRRNPGKMGVSIGLDKIITWFWLGKDYGLC